MDDAHVIDTLLDDLLTWDSEDRDPLRPLELEELTLVAPPTPVTPQASHKQQSTVEPPKTAGARIPSWKRRKLEIMEACQEVYRLQGELQRLRRKPAVKTEGDTASSDALPMRQSSTGINWKQAAEHEKYRKEEAESENAQLRVLIKKHQELAAVMAPVVSLAQSCQLVIVPYSPPDESPSELAGLFAALEQKLNMKLAQVRGKIRRLRDNATSGQKSCIVLDEASRPMARVRRITSMPFSVPDVVDIIWSYPHGGLMNGLALAVETQILSEDAVGFDFHMQVPAHAAGGSSFGVRTRGVMKRWTRYGCDLFQIAATREWLDTGSNVIAQTSEYGWGVVKEGACQSSWMLVTTESTLLSLHGDKADINHYTFTNQVLLPASRYLDDRLSQAFENSLLDSLIMLS